MVDADTLTTEQRTLLARWYPTVLERCKVRIRDPYDAQDVAQNVMVRLISELRRDKHYTVEYRVVVNNVIGWTIKEHFQGVRYDAELEEALAVARDDPIGELVDREFVRGLVERLPGRQREVATLRLLKRLDPDEIAVKLGIERNAVDQAWHNAKHALREMLLDG